MVYGIIGIAAFFVYLLYDINSVQWKNRILNKGFFVGSGLLIAATVGIVCTSVDNPKLFSGINFGMNIGSGIFIFFEMIFIVLLIYTLFFALPFEKTYIKNINNKPMVYKKGVYALCRHPGVIWFIGCFVCLGLEFSTMLVIVCGALFCLLDILYVVFQDNWTFVRLFGDYDKYKEETPFLVPTMESIKKCFRTMKG